MLKPNTLMIIFKAQKKKFEDTKDKIKRIYTKEEYVCTKDKFLSLLQKTLKNKRFNVYKRIYMYQR